MPTIAELFDPWGPTSSVLYETQDADFVRGAVSNTGAVTWRTLTEKEMHSHGTRIRAMQPDIDAAYNKLPPEAKGLFAQNVIAAMLKHHKAADLKRELDSRLGRIGWNVSDDAELSTQDALISEAFFPPGSVHDAYVAIRDILATAQSQITVVDGYIGTSLLQTLKAFAHRPTLNVNILTIASKLPADFATELATFGAQCGHFTVEVRGTRDFHDRFIAIDDSKFYHVGASIKDAGRTVFMINQIQDALNVDHAKRTIAASWTAATRIH